ncbi:MAG: hypothetical protein VX768_04200 [Planctomycetota bacterium]|nr:hypothetical protein [Planctomycetota bacterium]
MKTEILVFIEYKRNFSSLVTAAWFCLPRTVEVMIRYPIHYRKFREICLYLPLKQ